MSTPYIGFSNETLERLPRVSAGDVVRMPCGHDHELTGGEPALFYRCGDKSFLGAVGGRLTAGTRADVSGTIGDDGDKGTRE